jgi:hypothetical protein
MRKVTRISRKFVFTDEQRDKLKQTIANHAAARAILERMMDDLATMSMASTPPESTELTEIREKIFKLLRVRWVLPSIQDGTSYNDKLYTKEAAQELGEVLEKQGFVVDKPVRVQL